MLTKLLSSLEDENNPSLGPTLRCLKIFGLLQSKHRLKSLIYSLLHITGLLFVISHYIELWNVRFNRAKAFKNLSISMLCTLSVVKACTFLYWQKYWKDIIEYASALERHQLSLNDGSTNSIIAKYAKYSRIVMRLYKFIGVATILTHFLTPFVVFMSSSDMRVKIKNGSETYPDLMSSWMPFDRTIGMGYWISTIEQFMFSCYGAGIVVAYDGSAVTLMIYFAGQLKLLYKNCGRLFDKIDGEIITKASQRIKECHYHHLTLIKYSKLFNSLLSPVMFLYVVICSSMICANVIQFTVEETTLIQKIWVVNYLVAMIAQLFLYCWHSNEVLVMSNKVNDGVYESDWCMQDVKTRRNVLLLRGQLRKPIIFTAGPFTTLSIPTFITILKGAYSVYTFLDNQ